VIENPFGTSIIKLKKLYNLKSSGENLIVFQPMRCLGGTREILGGY
jgi:hypothetical protein